MRFIAFLTTLWLAGCTSRPAVQPISSRSCSIALRLQSGTDVRAFFESFAKDYHIKAAAITSAVGSVERARLRFANQPQSQQLNNGPFEVVALSGTLSHHGVHLHAALSDTKGQTVGGHLDRETVVYTTLEVVIEVLTDFEFERTLDTRTGYKELQITYRPGGSSCSL